jgi:hypothetical protein
MEKENWFWERWFLVLPFAFTAVVSTCVDSRPPGQVSIDQATVNASTDFRSSELPELSENLFFMLC